jgi:D-serine deaminase-like pyridoxal phosphate-dependent protein
LPTAECLSTERRTAPQSGLKTIETPSLLLDETKLKRNIARLRERLGPMKVTLRPHLKTSKCIDVARLALISSRGPAMVSTLREAEYFAAHGVRDIVYGVGLAPDKLDRIGAIRRDLGADLAVILDSHEQARAVGSWVRKNGERIPVLIEIDCDGHRSGVLPHDPETLAAIGRTLVENGAELRGVLTHAGESYGLSTLEALERAAEQERSAAAGAATLLRESGLPCPIVSVGSTPTAHFARDFSGITEVRAGVFMFFDLVQAGIGVCTVDDIAISVLTSVIGHRPDKGRIIVDAGWMALSRDRGTARQAVDQGYGLVCDEKGRPLGDLIVSEANQEHGIITIRPGGKAPPCELPIGARLRILPNHACATAAEHAHYHVLGSDGEPRAIWKRISGW